MLKDILKVVGAQKIEKSNLKLLKGGNGFGGYDNSGDGTCPDGQYWNDDCKRCEGIGDPHFAPIGNCN